MDREGNLFDIMAECDDLVLLKLEIGVVAFLMFQLLNCVRGSLD